MKINFLKGLSIFAVVGIHVINSFIGRTFPGSLTWIALVSTDQLSRFSVPLFVALSGYALGLKYSSAPLELKDFYLRRVSKLLPLYFLWTAVYVVSAKLVPAWNQSFSFWQVVFMGRAQYHLYYVPMIFQAYLLFPLLFSLIKKSPLGSLSFSLLLQILLFRWISAPGWNDQRQYLLFASWQFYFVLGIYMALVKPHPGKWLIMPILLGLGWGLGTALFGQPPSHDIIWATRFTRFPVLLFASAIIIAGLAGSHRTNRFISFLGINSYLIYLSHVLFLKIFTSGSINIPIIGATLIGILAFIVSRYLNFSLQSQARGI